MNATARATFARMQDSTAQDYEIITARYAEHLEQHADAVLAAMRLLGEGDAGYAVSRLEHSLQSASRAQRDGRDTDYVVMCLLHDIGDTLAPRNHGKLAAAVLEPYVSPRLTWIAEHHPVFQFHYYGRHVGVDPDLRERYRGHQWFDDTVEFCELYDENCFDERYDALPLEAFAPLVREVLGRERRDRPDV
jgi:predicted HD phosphohydrolase